MKPQVCDWDDIKHLLNNNDLGDAKFTILKKKRVWFVSKDGGGGEAMGIGSIILLSKSAARLSSVYVPTAWRGRGVATNLIKAMLGYCRQRNIIKIDARARKGGKYLRLGFLRKKTFKCGSGLYVWELPEAKE